MKSIWDRTGRWLPFCAVILLWMPHAEAQESVAGNAESGVNLEKLLQSDEPQAAQSQTQLSGEAVWILGVYCFLIVTGSLLGGMLPSWFRLTHTRMQTTISFVGGLMLGIGILQLLPHSIHELNSVSGSAQWMMTGIVFMFVLIRVFHFHNHGHAEVSASETPCEHDHEHSHELLHSHPQTHTLGWLGIAVGLSVHTLIDGIALGASVARESTGSTGSTGFALFGMGTFLAVFLHKPLDAVSITALMISSGWKKRSRNLINIGFSLMCPLGAALVVLGVHQLGPIQREFVGSALAFSAGVFVSISLSDLLPEMEFHSHHRVRLSVALGLGICLAWLITVIQPADLH